MLLSGVGFFFLFVRVDRYLWGLSEENEANKQGRSELVYRGHAKSWKRCIQRTKKKPGNLSQHISNNTQGKRSPKALECCGRKVHIIWKQHFLLNRLTNLVVKVHLKCVICFSISFRWYAVPNFRMQISRPPAYAVHISSKASVTTECSSQHTMNGKEFRRAKHYQKPQGLW